MLLRSLLPWPPVARCGHVMQIEDFTEGWEPLHVGLEGAALSIDGITQAPPHSTGGGA